MKYVSERANLVRPRALTFGEQRRSPDPLALEDDQGNPLERGDVRQGIAVDDEEVGVVAGGDETDARLGAKQPGGVRGRGLQRRGGRNSAATQSASS